MIRLLLLIIGIGLTLNSGSNNTANKEITVDNLINSNNGRYKVPGLYSSSIDNKSTLISNNNYSLTAWGCEYCNGYGVATIDKKGNDLTIIEFQKVPKLKGIGEVISISNNLKHATLLVNGKKVNTPVEIERESKSAYLIDNNWIIR